MIGLPELKGGATVETELSTAARSVAEAYVIVCVITVAARRRGQTFRTAGLKHLNIWLVFRYRRKGWKLGIG